MMPAALSVTCRYQLLLQELSAAVPMVPRRTLQCASATYWCYILWEFLSLARPGGRNRPVVAAY